jgi:PAS domain S-box-containing protein
MSKKSIDKEPPTGSRMPEAAEFSCTLATENIRTDNDPSCREAKRALVELLEQQEAIFETAMVGIMVLHNRIITKVNHRLTEILGYSAEEMLHRGPEQLHLSHDHFVEFGEKYYWRLSEKTIVQAEYPLRHKDGHTVWCLFSGKAIRPPDLREGAVWVIDDITRQKQDQKELQLSLALLHTTLDATADGILVVDMNGQVVLHSKRFAQMWNLPSEILDTKDLPSILTFVEQQLVDPHSLISGIKKGYDASEAISLDIIRFRDGRVFECYSHPRWLHNDMIGRVWSFRDITERMQMEERERQVEKTESLSRMAGAVAHHFNNMLAVTIGNLELIQEDLPENHAAFQNLVEAERSALRASEMSQLMLAYLGQTLGNPRLMDLSLVCERYLQQSAPGIFGSFIFHTRFQTPGPVIKADRSQMEQILKSLIINAVEAMEENPKGGIWIMTGTVPVSAVPDRERFPKDWDPVAEDYACLTVCDNGRGMGLDTIGRIFDPFFTDKFIGRGLGLPVTLGIVKSHGGCIAVESKPGAGTTIRVFLPLSAEYLYQKA